MSFYRNGVSEEITFADFVTRGRKEMALESKSPTARDPRVYSVVLRLLLFLFRL